MDRDPRQSDINPTRHRLRRFAAMAATACAAVTGAALLTTGQAATSEAASPATAPALGHLTKLGLAQTAPAEIWLGPGNRGWIAWSSNKNGRYQLAIMAPDGSIATAPRTIINGWSGVSFQPTLLGSGSAPLLVFSGQDNVKGPLSDGCVVGALPQSGLWPIQAWSLSSNCVFSNVGYGDAAANVKGTLSAAWAGGLGVEYRIGTSPQIPASGTDQQIPLSSGHADAVAEANDQFGNGDFYAAFYRFFSTNKSSDGVYVKDLTTGGPVIKAPKSGTESVTYPAQPQRVAMATVSAKGGGTYVAYCSNAGTCGTFLLWKVGTSKTIAVPHTKLAVGLAMSRGPGGRLWLAWYDEQSNRVYTVRTNKKDTRFGPPASFPATPCFADGNTHLALSAGDDGRLDVALECLANAGGKATLYVTQAEAGLTIKASPAKITNKHAVKVTFTVTDAGDPVSGAKVALRGAARHTGSNGKVTFTFAKGTAPGTYRATALAADYVSAATSVRVVS
jgi:hypothetical protein